MRVIDLPYEDTRAVCRRAHALACLAPEGRAWAVHIAPGPRGRSPLEAWDLVPAPRRLQWWDNRWIVAGGTVWSARASGPGRVMALARAASRLESLAVVRGEARRRADAPLLLVELAFEEHNAGPGHWGDHLPGARLILPRRAIVGDGDRSWVIDALPVAAGEDPDRAAARFMTPPPHDETALSGDWPSLDGPDFAGLVQDALGLLRHGALHKVVLARAIDRPLRRPIEPAALLQRLRGQGDHDACAYAWQLDHGGVFCGSTPELLLASRGEAIATMALAGSRPRSADPGLDRQLSRELMASTKEMNEHQLVVEHIRSMLGDRCHQLMVPPGPRIRRLSRVQHLETRISGRVNAVDPLELVGCLHPTPAVCGLPVPAARDWILRREGLHRGLYCGVLGWMTPRASRFVVPLRGGIVAPDRVRCFAGAGIVPTSEPAAELAETELKFSAMRDALDGLDA